MSSELLASVLTLGLELSEGRLDQVLDHLRAIALQEVTQRVQFVDGAWQKAEAGRNLQLLFG